MFVEILTELQKVAKNDQIWESNGNNYISPRRYQVLPDDDNSNNSNEVFIEKGVFAKGLVRWIVEMMNGGITSWKT